MSQEPKPISPEPDSAPDVAPPFRDLRSAASKVSKVAEAERADLLAHARICALAQRAAVIPLNRQELVDLVKRVRTPGADPKVQVTDKR